MDTTDRHGLLDVITVGMLGTLPAEIMEKPDLAALLDLVGKGSGDSCLEQLEIETSVACLIEGEETSIQRAMRHLSRHGAIRICPASCEVLWRSGINPIGAAALAHARGPEIVDSDMMPTRIRMHRGPASGHWATIVHVIEEDSETIGMEIALASGFNWVGWGPHLSYRWDYDMPTTVAMAAAGRRLGNVIEHEALDGEIRIEHMCQSSGTIALDMQRHSGTVGWLLHQHYAEDPAAKDLLRRMDIMKTALRSDVNA